MFSYELYLTKPYNGKDIVNVTTNNKLNDLNEWLIYQVNKGVISKEIANSVLFVA